MTIEAYNDGKLYFAGSIDNAPVDVLKVIARGASAYPGSFMQDKDYLAFTSGKENGYRTLVKVWED